MLQIKIPPLQNVVCVQLKLKVRLLLESIASESWLLCIYLSVR